MQIGHEGGERKREHHEAGQPQHEDLGRHPDAESELHDELGQLEEDVNGDKHQHERDHPGEKRAAIWRSR